MKEYCIVTFAHKKEIVHFLLDAKRHTYAAQGDDATVTPFLLGSRQLEYQAGQYLYRDIYFGGAYFGGQEIVYEHNRLLWTMSYAGGVVPATAPTENVASIYTFLRSALLLITHDAPYRGPRSYNDGPYVYINESWGDIDRFHGYEIITDVGNRVYDLYYSGGFLR